MVVGGAAGARIDDPRFRQFGLRVIHGWGMTNSRGCGEFHKRELDAYADAQYPCANKRAAAVRKWYPGRKR